MASRRDSTRAQTRSTTHTQCIEQVKWYGSFRGVWKVKMFELRFRCLLAEYFNEAVPASTHMASLSRELESSGSLSGLFRKRHVQDGNPETVSEP